MINIKLMRRPLCPSEEEVVDPLISWIVKNIDHADDVMTFMAIPVRAKIEQYLVSGLAWNDWWAN